MSWVFFFLFQMCTKHSKNTTMWKSKVFNNMQLRFIFHVRRDDSPVHLFSIGSWSQGFRNHTSIKSTQSESQRFQKQYAAFTTHLISLQVNCMLCLGVYLKKSRTESFSSVSSFTVAKGQISSEVFAVLSVILTRGQHQGWWVDAKLGGQSVTVHFQ